MKPATAVTTNEGLTGLAAQIIAAEQHRRREIMKADDAGIRDLDTHPAIVAAEDALYALQQQVPDVARTLDDVLARAALYYAPGGLFVQPGGRPAAPAKLLAHRAGVWDAQGADGVHRRADGTARSRVDATAV